MKELYLLASSELLSLLSGTSQGHLPRVGTIPHGLRLSTSVNNYNLSL